MYCIQCGVKLSDGQTQCPLCRTQVCHPQVKPSEEKPLYPVNTMPAERKTPAVAAIMLTALWVLAIGVVMLCDLQIHGRITWSGFPVGALLTGYVWLVLPAWFRSANPVIFVPCGFAAAIGYLLYVDLAVEGGWFLDFALPVAGGLGLITTALTALLRYVKNGRLYTVGGTLMGLGGFMPVIEWLLSRKTGLFYGWSFYPLAALVMLGGWLIFLGICRPVRETMKRKFFF